MDKRFIQNIQGKDFIKFEGLLNEFHINGGKEIYTKIIQNEPLIIQATVKGRVGTFQGIGDADENNVNRLIANHKIRMAETRAIARALRWYNNIGMCSADEMGGNEVKKTSKSTFKQLLWVKVKNYLDKEDISDTDILEAINIKSGIVVKNKKDITEDMAKEIINAWVE